MARKTILVVDDEPNSLFVTSQILKDHSYQVITAENGNSALDILKDEKVNLVVTDERMPDISGMEVLRETKKYDFFWAVLSFPLYSPFSKHACTNNINVST